MKEIKEVEFTPGTDLEDAIREAIGLAKRENCIVKFSFNGVPMQIYEYSDITEEVSGYFKSQEKAGEYMKWKRQQEQRELLILTWKIGMSQINTMWEIDEKIRQEILRTLEKHGIVWKQIYLQDVDVSKNNINGGRASKEYLEKYYPDANDTEKHQETEWDINKRIEELTHMYNIDSDSFDERAWNREMNELLKRRREMLEKKGRP